MRDESAGRGHCQRSAKARTSAINAESARSGRDSEDMAAGLDIITVTAAAAARCHGGGRRSAQGEALVRYINWNGDSECAYGLFCKITINLAPVLREQASSSTASVQVRRSEHVIKSVTRMSPGGSPKRNYCPRLATL